MKRKIAKSLVVGLAALVAGALSVGAQATETYRNYDDYKKPDKDRPVFENDYRNCTFFDKIHFTYPVRVSGGGSYEKDFDVIVAGKYSQFMDLTGAVADKLGDLCKGRGYANKGAIYCPFGNIDENKIKIKGVDLAVSCR